MSLRALHVLKIPRALFNVSSDGRLRAILILIAALAATVVYGVIVNDSYPIRAWMVWDYVRIWAWQAFFCAACLSFGHLVLVKIIRAPFPPVELAVMSMPAGVVAFVLGMYIGGALHLYGEVFAVALPALMTLAGLPRALPAALAALARVRDDHAPWSPLSRAVAAFGLLSLGLLYLQCATPDSIGYDATWTHLVVGEDYAREGRIVPFVAETAKNLPHLHSLLYTWGFLVPGFEQAPLRWMMGQHMEVLLFLWTLVGIAAAVHWMLDDTRINGSWAAYFLFPGFFVYDASLAAGSDHVAAFFAIPLLLASVRAAERLSPRLCLLAGLFGGAAMHTKIQCMYLLVPVAALLAVRWTTLLIQGLARSRRSPDGRGLDPVLWRGPLLFIAGLAIGFGPHMVKNWIFYRNPVYPLLMRTFPGSVPTFVDLKFDAMEAAASSSTFIQRIPSSLRLMLTFSLDRQSFFEGKMAYFGPLFSLLIPIVLLNGRRRRLVVGLLLAQGSVLMWAIVYRMDRNLQVLLPWLVAVAAAAIAATWRSGWLARLGIIPLVLLQVAWGGRFIIAGGADRVRTAIDVVRGDLEHPGTPPSRYEHYRRSYRDIGASLPLDAVLLLHTAHIHLGINRRTMSDWAGWQYAIDYRDMKTPRDVFLRYRQLGITHVLWNNYDFPSLKQEDVLFFAFVRRYGVPVSAPGGFSLWKLPAQPPPVERPLRVVALGLQGYGDGLYAIDKLNVFEDLPFERKVFPPPDAPAGDPSQLLAGLKRADAVLMVRGRSLDPASLDELGRCFNNEHDYYGGYGIPGYSVHLRRRGQSGCADPLP